MRYHLFVLICLASFVSICGASLVDARVVLTDPNASGKITAKVYAQTDPRLSQSVTYEARLKPVQEIVSDLREMTGVKLSAGARDSDWPVRSRKLNIFVKDVPLCELMDSMARVLKFRWSRADDIKPMIYRLKVNDKIAAEADAMMKRAEKMQEEMWRKRRQEWMDAIDKYGATPASQLTPLRETDPQIYEQVLLGSLPAISALLKEVPEAKERFLAGKNFRVSTDDLDPGTKTLLFNAGNEFWKHLQRIGYIDGKKTQTPAGYGDVLKTDDHFDVVYKRLDVGTFTPSLRWGSASVSDIGYWHLDKNGRDFEINGFRYLGTAWNRHISVSNIKINEGIDVDEVRASETDRGELFGARAEDAQKLEESLYPSEPLVEHAQSAELEKKIKLNIEKPKPDDNPMMRLGHMVALFEKAISEASGMNVVSDAWLNIPVSGRMSMPSNEAKLSEFLEAFCSGLNYNWDKPGPIMEFRHRKWAKMRLNQIPDDWVATWSKNTKANGYLSLADLASISCITYDQAEESVRHDPVIGLAGGMYGLMLEILDDNLPWLRFYASLKSRQRELLTEQYGLNGHMLTTDQWKLAQPMFDRIGTTRGEALMRSGTTASEDSKRVIVWFKEILADTGQTDRTWTVWLPKYTPPTPAPEAQQPAAKPGV